MPFRALLSGFSTCFQPIPTGGLYTLIYPQYPTFGYVLSLSNLFIPDYLHTLGIVGILLTSMISMIYGCSQITPYAKQDFVLCKMQKGA